MQVSSSGVKKPVGIIHLDNSDGTSFHSPDGLVNERKGRRSPYSFCLGVAFTCFADGY
ncbi:hypothetical protein HPP92_014938 [Vanilla planifolia]|uniref:Uncharacterized protein n=1 Tax=Vanilla planifolia TaxID=51239 RepID=A0A835UV88_VANPL|nr:hypothetical protein HPP92_014938 [Vanilla planifolia]